MAQKFQFFDSLVLMLISFLRRSWRSAKQILPKIAIAWSEVLMLSYNSTSNLCSFDVSASVNNNINDPSINILDKNFNFNFYNNNRLPYEGRKYQAINFLTPKGSSNSGDMNIFSFLLIRLLSFNFLRKQKINPCVTIFLNIITFQCAFFLDSQNHRTV